MLKRTLKDSIRGLDRVPWLRSDHFEPRSNPLCLRYSIHPIHYFPEIRPLDKPWARTALRLAQRHFSQGFPSQMAFSLPLAGNEAFKRKIYSRYHQLPSKMKTYFLGPNPYWHRCISICYLFDK